MRLPSDEFSTGAVFDIEVGMVMKKVIAVKTKGILLAILVIVSLFTLAACASNPEDVELASTDEIVRYARQHYGAASSYEVTEGENSRTVTFCDKEYGFFYSVKSYVMELGIDGSTFGYTEGKTSDFDQNYYGTLYGFAEEKFGSKYDMSYGYSMEDGYQCHVSHVDAEDAEPVAREIGKYLKKLDTRHYYSKSEACVAAYHGDETNYIGSWHISDGKYYYYADENTEQMTAQAKAQAGDASVTYLYWEQMDISEVPGLADWELVYNTMDDGTLVTLYWFKINGEKHFLADVKVWNIGDVYYSDMLEDKRSN